VTGSARALAHRLSRTASRTLARRLVLLTMLVALASVTATGLTQAALDRATARQTARAALARDADTLASVETTNSRLGRVVGLTRAIRLIEGHNVSVLATGDPTRATAPFRAADITSLTAGTRPMLSATRLAGGRAWLVEGRAAGELAVLVAQPVSDAVASTRTPARRYLLPLGLGLLVGALAGLALARQLGRPITRLATAARQLSAGRRDVRLEPEGPAELADLAQAVNGLTDALASSEARQRQFLLDVSHELRTPLTAVSGYAEALADGVLGGEEATRAGGVIRDEAARLAHRVNDLLALARTQADDFRVEPARTDLGELLRAAARAWQPRAARAAVPLTLELPTGPLEAVTDAERLRQAVDALVDNALRVLPPGAPLVLAGGGEADRAWAAPGSPTTTWPSPSSGGG
jgi:two-component system OmpR family sensor kinase